MNRDYYDYDSVNGRLLPRWNAAEVHLRNLKAPLVEVTYLGITEVVRSKKLWKLINDGRRTLLAPQLEAIRKTK